MARKKKPEEQAVDLLRAVSADSKDRIGLVEDMHEVEFFPTLLTGYNRASGIGGHPRKRIMVIHGPPQKGKSVLANALAESARVLNHATVIDDIEHAGEKEWYTAITPKTGLAHSMTLDEMRRRFHTMMDNLVKGKNARRKVDRIPEDAGVLYVVDTITMLYPQGLLDKLEKDGIDKMYPLQAMWISVWMNEVVRRLEESDSSLILVVQERKNLDPNTRRTWKLPGGEAIQYDNCLRVRVTHSEQVKKGKQVVGIKSYYEVQNNKIDGTTMEKAALFTSNGKGDVPKGLDLVREAIEECKARDCLEKSSDHVTVGVGPLNWTVEGGMEDLRLYLMENKREFKRLVNTLNKEARR